MAATCSKTSSDSKRGNLEEDDIQMPLKLVKELLKQQQSTLKVFWNYSTFHDAYRQHFYEQYYSILKKLFDHK